MAEEWGDKFTRFAKYRSFKGTNKLPCVVPCGAMAFNSRFNCAELKSPFSARSNSRATSFSCSPVSWTNSMAEMPDARFAPEIEMCAAFLRFGAEYRIPAAHIRHYGM